MQRLYDVIGDGYAATRRTDPRIAARIWQEFGDARTVLNVGAGTGSYEPPDRDVVAVEPSAVMRAQRPLQTAPCLAADAGGLPFRDHSFDAAMAVLSDHHWPDPIAGLREMRRVARRVVVFQFDASHPERFWLTRDYLPEFARLGVGAPSPAARARAIGARTEPVPIPWDCLDGFFHAYWRRPEAYLRHEVRRGTSGVERRGAGGRGPGRVGAARRPGLGPVGRAQPAARGPGRGRSRCPPAHRLMSAPLRILMK